MVLSETEKEYIVQSFYTFGTSVSVCLTRRQLGPHISFCTESGLGASCIKWLLAFVTGWRDEVKGRQGSMIL